MLRPIKRNINEIPFSVKADSIFSDMKPNKKTFRIDPLNLRGKTFFPLWHRQQQIQRLRYHYDQISSG